MTKSSSNKKWDKKSFLQDRQFRIEIQLYKSSKEDKNHPHQSLDEDHVPSNKMENKSLSSQNKLQPRIIQDFLRELDKPILSRYKKYLDPETKDPITLDQTVNALLLHTSQYFSRKASQKNSEVTRFLRELETSYNQTTCPEIQKRKCFILGLSYWRAIDIEYNPSRAEIWLTLAGDQHAASLALLGQISIDYRENEEKSCDYYIKAIALHSSYALAELGYHHRKMAGSSISALKKLTYLQQAADFYQQAIASRGNPSSAFNNLGYLYNWGLGVDSDFSKAQDYYKYSIRLGNASALSNLAYNFYLSESSNNYDKAIYFYRVSLLGNNASQTKIDITEILYQSAVKKSQTLYMRYHAAISLQKPELLQTDLKTDSDKILTYFVDDMSSASLTFKKQTTSLMKKLVKTPQSRNLSISPRLCAHIGFIEIENNNPKKADHYFNLYGNNAIDSLTDYEKYQIGSFYCSFQRFELGLSFMQSLNPEQLDKETCFEAANYLYLSKQQNIETAYPFLIHAIRSNHSAASRLLWDITASRLFTGITASIPTFTEEEKNSSTFKDFAITAVKDTLFFHAELRAVAFSEKAMKLSEKDGNNIKTLIYQYVG